MCDFVDGLTHNPLQSEWVITFPIKDKAMYKTPNDGTRILDFRNDKGWLAWCKNSKTRMCVFKEYNKSFVEWRINTTLLCNTIDIARKHQCSKLTCTIISKMIYGEAPHRTELNEEIIGTKFPEIGVNF